MQGIGRIRKAVEDLLGEYNNSPHEIIISEPIGIIPRELEKMYPAAHYDLVLSSWFPLTKLPEVRREGHVNDLVQARIRNKPNYAERRVVVNYLSKLVAKFLEKTKDCYSFRIGYVRSTHREILERAARTANVDITFLPSRNTYRKVVERRDILLDNEWA